jgi:hypothetical protein
MNQETTAEPKKIRYVKNKTEREYNTEYMYKYKQVKPVSTERLLANKNAYLKKIRFIDEELELRKMNEQELVKKAEEDKKNKNIQSDFEKMKNLYEKIKSVFENDN